MEYPESSHNISIMWRRKKFTVDMNPHATLKELGDELQKLTNVKADTMRFIVPQINNKGSKLLTPFSNEHERLSIEESSIIEGKPIRMMGVSENEVDEVLQGAKANLRIAGFEEEEKRLRQRQSYRPHVSLQLPQGPYIFCDFRTLELPGIELNPPASEALRRMHRLAADPGIVAIMNKHRWRVGIMTEMAPVGYVGISPKCILGFNKNRGEEISLRLRTDDLKGFRKYESIKKTLLHELAHMVHSEHDANFFALNKQLNQEAASLDWTRSTGYTLNGVRRSEDYEEDFYFDEGSNSSQKLGGDVSDQLASARATSVAAAYRRLANVSTNSLGISEVHEEPDPDDYEFHTHEEPNEMDYVGKENSHIYRSNKVHLKPYQEPDPDDHQNVFERDPDDHQNVFEPDPDDHQNDFEPDPDEHQNVFEPDPDDSQGDKTLGFGHFHSETTQCVPLINRQLEASLKHTLVGDSEHSEELGIKLQAQNSINEPDPDELEAKRVKLGCLNTSESDEIAALITGTNEDQSSVMKDLSKDDHGESQAEEVMQAEPDPDDNLVQPVDMSRMQIDEPDPDDQELQRIQDPVRVFCNRLQKAIVTLHAEVVPAQATVVLQTLFKIISNVIEHPGDMKYRRLRKDNPTIKRTVVNYKAAMEILLLIGFSEDLVTDELGKAETYLVLKRNDPGLFWLAKSSLETSISR